MSLPTGYISPSQVNSYRDCPRCYELAYVQKRPKFASIHFAIGGALHKGAELVARRIIAEEEPQLDEALTLGLEDFDKRTSEPRDPESGVELQLDLAKYDDLGQAKDDTARFVRCALDALPGLFRERRVIAAELDLSDLPEDVLAAAFPFPVKGRIDFLYGDRETMEPDALTDLKSSSKRGGPDENGVLQFSFYGLPAWKAGAPWRIGSDVQLKTKSPELLTYWAHGTGYLTDDNYKVAQEIIVDTAGRISRGDFPIGKGWNGQHDYEHGLGSFSIAAQGFAA